MASDEKYLWVLTYRFHEDKRMWLAYFRDWQEAEACVERMMELFPCAERLGLVEQVTGFKLAPYYYHYACSHQRHADELDKKSARERDKQTFPLAPLASDYLSSFVVSIDNVSPCLRCEWPVLAPVQQLQELSRSGRGERRESR